MAKELSKVGIQTGQDIKAPHVTQSVDAFTGLDAYDITISGSLKVTGSTDVKGSVHVTNGNIVAFNGEIIANSGDITTGKNINAPSGYVIAQGITSSNDISASGTIYANALDLEGSKIEYFPATNILKLDDGVKLGLGHDSTGTEPDTDLVIYSSGTTSHISGSANLIMEGKTVILRNNNSSSAFGTSGQIHLRPNNHSDGSPGGYVLISGSSSNLKLDVRGPITSSGDIQTEGNIINTDGYALFQRNSSDVGNSVLNVRQTNAACNIAEFGTSADFTQFVIGPGSHITASANISASGYVVASNVTSSKTLIQGTSTSLDAPLIKIKTTSFAGTGQTPKYLNIQNNNNNSLLLFSSYNHPSTSFGNYSPKLTINRPGPSFSSTNSGSLSITVKKGFYTATNASSNNTVYKEGLAVISTGEGISQLQIMMERGYDGGSIGDDESSLGRMDICSEMEESGVSPEFQFYMLNNDDMPDIGSLNPAGSLGGLRIRGQLAIGGQAYKSTGTSWDTSSDIRLKENIVTASIDICYDGVKNLPLKHFKWKGGVQESPLQDNNVLGWIAQDVEKVFPKAISKGKFTTYSTYTGSSAITGSDGESILKPGRRYQDVLAGSEIIEDRHILQSDQIVKMMYGAIQKLQEKVEALELQISGSNS